MQKSLFQKFFLIACVVVLLLSAACQQTSTSSSSTSSTTTVATTSKQDATTTTTTSSGLIVSDENVFPIVDKKVDLSVWVALSVPMPENMDTCPQTIAYEEKTNVHVNWTVVNGAEKATMLNLSLAGGDYPDIYATSLTTDQLWSMKQNNIITPLNSLIEEHGFNAKKAFVQNPIYKEYLTAPDGNIYSLYKTDAGVHMLSQNKMFIYKPWLEASGLAMPSNTEEFKNILMYFRENDMNQNGDSSDEIPLVGSYSAWGGDPLAFLMNPFQLYPNNEYLYVDESDNLKFAAIEDGWRDGLRYIHSLYNDGLIAEETYVQDATQLKSLVNIPDPKSFITGVVPGAYQLVFVDLSVLTTGYTDFIAVPPLEGPTGLRQAGTSGVGSFSFVDVISTSCEYPEVAMKWLDYWLSDDAAFESLYGLETQDYTWADEPAINGDAKSIVRKRSPDGYLTFYLNSWSMNTMPMNDSVYNKYRTVAKPGDQGYELYTAAKLYEPYYKLTGWANVRWAVDEDMVEQITLLSTPINEYVAQAYTEFILGVRDIETDWESYIEELDTLGLEEYIELQSSTLK